MARLSPSAIVILIIILVILYNPGSSPSYTTSAASSNATITQFGNERQYLSTISQNSYRDFTLTWHKPWHSLDVPGFRPNDGMNWGFLPLVWEKVIRKKGMATMGEAVMLDAGMSNESLLLYRNVSGWVRGEWTRTDLREHMVLEKSVVDVHNTSNVEARVKESGRAVSHNVTGHVGKVEIHLIEDAAEQNLDSLSIPEHIEAPSQGVNEGAGKAVDDFTGDVDGGDEGERNGKRDDSEADQSQRTVENPYNIIHARITLSDPASGNDYTYKTLGIHNRLSGSILLTTTSADFAGIFALPHLTLSPYAWGVSRAFLGEYINKTLGTTYSPETASSNRPWTPTTAEEREGVLPAPQCALVVWLQQYRQPIRSASLHSSQHDSRVSATQAAREAFAALEAEIRFPIGSLGIWSSPPPPLHFQMTAFSPDCGYLLGSKGPPEVAPSEAVHLVGMRTEVRIAQGRAAMLLLCLVLGAQLCLLIEQIHRCSTPSKKSRVSFWTMVMLSLGDGFMGFAFLFFSSVAVRLYTMSLAVTFLSLVMGIYYWMRFLLDVWAVQEPERFAQRRRSTGRRTSNSTGPASTTTNMTHDTNTATSDTTATTIHTDTGASPLSLPFFRPPPPSTTTTTTNSPTPLTPSAIYTRYILTLLLITFLSIWVASSFSPTLRNIYTNALTFLYLSFLTPQIYRNTMRNTRTALAKRFILGQSLLRLGPIAYFWAYEDNVLFIPTSPRTLMVFAVWVWIQLVLIGGQEILGPRFFLPKRGRFGALMWVDDYVPVGWDYHPLLREDEEFSLLPLGGVVESAPGSPVLERRGSLDTASRWEKQESFSGRQGKGRRLFDCAICMQSVEVPVVGAGESMGSASSSATAGAMGDSLTGFLARRHYSVTPCRHVFHSSCLENSMDYRLSCPVCREGLPPL